ncbi:MAG: response regulator [Syntrophobacteraceae bacterium]
MIDDDLMVLDVFEAMLSSAGYDVSVIDDPLKAVELVWKEEFSAVITDLGMPNLNGWAVARQVKAKNATTPVILVTGWGEQHEQRDLLSCGVDLLFSKPVDLQTLVAAIEELMANSTRRPGRNRRHKRFPGKRGERVRISHLAPDSPTQLGELLDISRGGLCFGHNEGEIPAGGLLKVEIRSPEGFELDLSPALVIYDMMMLKTESLITATTSSRCCGIQFEDLTGEKRSQLECLIRSRASDDKSKVTDFQRP